MKVKVRKWRDKMAGGGVESTSIQCVREKGFFVKIWMFLLAKVAQLPAGSAWPPPIPHFGIILRNFTCPCLKLPLQVPQHLSWHCPDQHPISTDQKHFFTCRATLLDFSVAQPDRISPAQSLRRTSGKTANRLPSHPQLHAFCTI